MRTIKIAALRGGQEIVLDDNGSITITGKFPQTITYFSRDYRRAVPIESHECDYETFASVLKTFGILVSDLSDHCNLGDPEQPGDKLKEAFAILKDAAKEFCEKNQIAWDGNKLIRVDISDTDEAPSEMVKMRYSEYSDPKNNLIDFARAVGNSFHADIAKQLERITEDPKQTKLTPEINEILSDTVNALVSHAGGEFLTKKESFDLVVKLESIMDQGGSKSSDHQRIIEWIIEELIRAENKHPHWPADVVYKAAIVSEESGELMRAAVQYEMEGGDIEEVRTEAIQTAATCIRLLLNLPDHKTIKENREPKSCTSCGRMVLDLMVIGDHQICETCYHKYDKWQKSRKEN